MRLATRRSFSAFGRSGIGVGRMYQRTLARDLSADRGRAILAPELVARALLTLPTHHYLTDADVDRIEHVFEERMH